MATTIERSSGDLLAMSSAKLIYDGREYDLDLVEGSEGEVAIDVRSLRKATGGAITYDPGYGNTGSCSSAITFIDGEQGILRSRAMSSRGSSTPSSASTSSAAFLSSRARGS